MDKKARVKALIENPANPFTVADTAYLEGLTDERLAALEAHKPTTQTAPAATPAAAAAPALTEAALLEASPLLKSMAAALPALATLAAAAPSLVAMSEQQKTNETARRLVLVTKLKACQTVYSEEQLNALATADLERVAQLVKADVPAAVDYSLAGAPRAASTPVEKIEAPTGVVSHIRAAETKKQKAG